MPFSLPPYSPSDGPLGGNITAIRIREATETIAASPRPQPTSEAPTVGRTFGGTIDEFDPVAALDPLAAPSPPTPPPRPLPQTVSLSSEPETARLFNLRQHEWENLPYRIKVALMEAAGILNNVACANQPAEDGLKLYLVFGEGPDHSHYKYLVSALNKTEALQYFLGRFDVADDEWESGPTVWHIPYTQCPAGIVSGGG